jgi:hypothetical protein
MREGWKCPGCGRCWAPQVISCSECEKVAAKPAPYVPAPQPVYPDWQTLPAPYFVGSPNTCGATGITPNGAIPTGGTRGDN